MLSRESAPRVTARNGTGRPAPGQNMVMAERNGYDPEIFNFTPGALAESGGQALVVKLVRQADRTQLVAEPVAGVKVRVTVLAGKPVPAERMTRDIWLILTLQSFGGIAQPCPCTTA